MYRFTITAHNDKLFQINEVDELSYAYEMYKCLTYELDFPSVRVVDNVTGELLLSRIVENGTAVEYVAPILQACLVSNKEEEELSVEILDLIQKITALTNDDEIVISMALIALQIEAHAYSLDELKSLKEDLIKLLEKMK